ncbi:MAG: EscU/YscU/HrcU family type III secretion system export apparatus switch protein [Pseudomonadota bacterium]
MSDNAPDDPEGKIKTAVALGYDKELDIAPKVVAKGNRSFAEQIIAIAKEHNIPISENDELVRVLAALELNSLIPLETYAVVAEILSYIYQKNQQSNQPSEEKK